MDFPLLLPTQKKIRARHLGLEHGDNDAPSESSSSSDSEVEAESTDETEIEDEGNEVSDVGVKEEDSSSSGYESEDSSANEVNLDSSGLPTSDEEVPAQNALQNLKDSFPRKEGGTLLAKLQQNVEKDDIQFDKTDCVLRCKSVFKCRLCPRIVCLSEETLKAHLSSKRHSRSEKLLKEGRLKLMLNDNGQIEGEAHPDKQDATTSSGQELGKSKKKDKGRRKQRKRSRQETSSDRRRRLSREEKRLKNDG